jgi:threonine/homoserine/homoserine lactone efflux protein
MVPSDLLTADAPAGIVSAMDLLVLSAFVVAVFLLSVAPGPDMLFIVANAGVGGRRAGVVAAAGMSTGLAAHTVAAAAGLTALIQAAPQALTVVRVAGAVFLLYLAIASWRASRADVADAAPPEVTRRPLRKVFGMATLTNLANPKVIFFYIAFFPQFLTEGGWPTPVQFLLMGAILIVVGLVVDASVGLAAGTLSLLLRRRPAVQRWLSRVSAAIFGALAVRLVVDR